MEVTITVPEKFAEEARARGVSLEVYVQEILARRALDAAGEQRSEAVLGAVDRILELRKGNKLSGLRIKDLVHQDHKH